MIGQSMLERFDRLRVLAITLFAVIAILGGFFVGVAVAGAEAVLRAKDPRPPVNNPPSPPPPLAHGIQRIHLDGHLYYWKYQGRNVQDILIHAAGCTNHVVCQPCPEHKVVLMPENPSVRTLEIR